MEQDRGEQSQDQNRDAGNHSARRATTCLSATG
jgi:hypothetical protein